MRSLFAEYSIMYTSSFPGPGSGRVEAEFELDGSGRLRLASETSIKDLRDLSFCLFSVAQVQHLSLHLTNYVLQYAAVDFSNKAGVAYKLLNLEAQDVRTQMIGADILLLASGVVLTNVLGTNKRYYDSADQVNKLAFALITDPCSPSHFLPAMPPGQPYAARFMSTIQAAQTIICESESAIELSPDEHQAFLQRIHHVTTGMPNRSSILQSISPGKPVQAAMMVSVLHTATQVWQAAFMVPGFTPDRTWLEHTLLHSIGPALTIADLEERKSACYNSTRDLSYALELLHAENPSNGALAHLKTRLKALRRSIDTSTPDFPFASDGCMTSSTWM